ncbi:MBL fold metallo-hydrolase [Candidatus Kaiserbacteria bacterium]|nr:MBL fold metallo-hydrolase [Candidatus Kaiserbacteria bacterium]
MRRSVLVTGIVIVILAVAAALIWWAVFEEDRGGILTVSFLDVGQGDAIFIDAPSGRQVLIDGGPDRSVLRELGKLMPWYDRSIDVVIATHPDADHISGLVDVLQRYRVQYIFHPGVEKSTGPAESMLVSVAKEGANEVYARRGQIIELGDGAYIEILFPDRDVSDVETNTASIIAHVVYGATSFILTGDAPQSIEKYLVQLDGSELHSNILKAGHHGSKTSSSELFVGFVNPEYAVFSHGCDNSYGHPHKEVVDLFARFEIPTLDTCTEGTVTFVSDGQKVMQQ